MVAWQVVAAVILAISLVLLSLLIFRIMPHAKEWAIAAFRMARYTICCNLLGCTPWNVLSWSDLNPACWMCGGCECGTECK